jgi:hypothetical protein
MRNGQQSRKATRPSLSRRAGRSPSLLSLNILIIIQINSNVVLFEKHILAHFRRREGLNGNVDSKKNICIFVQAGGSELDLIIE